MFSCFYNGLPYYFLLFYDLQMRVCTHASTSVYCLSAHTQRSKYRIKTRIIHFFIFVSINWTICRQLCTYVKPPSKLQALFLNLRYGDMKACSLFFLSEFFFKVCFHGKLSAVLWLSRVVSVSFVSYLSHKSVNVYIHTYLILFTTRWKFQWVPSTRV